MCPVALRCVAHRETFTAVPGSQFEAAPVLPCIPRLTVLIFTGERIAFAPSDFEVSRTARHLPLCLAISW